MAERDADIKSLRERVAFLMDKNDQITARLNKVQSACLSHGNTLRKVIEWSFGTPMPTQECPHCGMPLNEEPEEEED